MKWPWVRRSRFELVLSQRTAEANEVIRLTEKLAASDDALAKARARSGATRDGAEELYERIQADLDAERAYSQSLLTQLALLQSLPGRPTAPPQETPLPTFPAVVRIAIQGRAGKAKNYYAALDVWARSQLRAGVDAGSIANAISNGEADTDLEIEQEVV